MTRHAKKEAFQFTGRLSRLVSMYDVAFSHKYHYDDAVPGVTVSATCDLCKQDNFMDNPNAIILTCSNLDLNNTFCIVVCCSDLFANNSGGGWVPGRSAWVCGGSADARRAFEIHYHPLLYPTV